MGGGRPRTDLGRARRPGLEATRTAQGGSQPSAGAKRASRSLTSGFGRYTEGGSSETSAAGFSKRRSAT
ncbi:hypothetical protein IWW55_004252, partial [Coemansia sp. RSA 2706]